MTIINMVGSSSTDSGFPRFTGMVTTTSNSTADGSQLLSARISDVGSSLSTYSGSSARNFRLTSKSLTTTLDFLKFENSYVYYWDYFSGYVRTFTYAEGLTVNKNNVDIGKAPVNTGSGTVTGNFAVLDSSRPYLPFDEMGNFSELYEFPMTITNSHIFVDLSSIQGKTAEELRGVVSLGAYGSEKTMIPAIYFYATAITINT